MKKHRTRFITLILCVIMVISLLPKHAYAAAPTTPTGLTASFVSPNQVSLSWNYSYDATFYYIYRSTSYTGTFIPISSVTNLSYLDSDISPNTTYYYKVQAYNSSGASTESAIASVSTSQGSSGISATAIDNNRISLSWNTFGGASYYMIYRSDAYYGTYSCIAASTSNNYTDTGLSSGSTYYYKIEGINNSGSSIYYSSAVSATALSGRLYGSSIAAERLYGSNRYETATAISQSGWDYSYYAVVVSGENYPDALCSAPLAAKHNAPILLTTKGNLDARTWDELLRLRVKSVFLIGGVNVISSKTEQAIRNLGITVTRIAGSDRYDTSLRIAQKIGGSTEAVLATGGNYADVLSIAPIAAMKRMPILLTPNKNISPGLLQYLKYNISKTYVVGGSNAVSTAVLTQLPAPERLSGSNRYETNIEIIKRFINELDLQTVYIATGRTYPDALAGSVLASKSKSPVILVSSPLDLATSSFIDLKGADIHQVTAFGGTSVISSSLLNKITDSTVGSGLSAPAGISASSTASGQIYVSWNPVSNATYYYIYKSTSYNGSYSFITSVISPWYTDSDLSSNTTYYYKVKAFNNSSSSSYSNVASTTTSYGYPSTPTGLSATAQDSNQIYLSWNPVSNATYYYIYRATSDSPYSQIATVSSANYPDLGLMPNTTYYYKISAINSYGTSSYSTQVLATTGPSAPTLSAIAAGTNLIVLSWSSVEGASSYTVYRADSASGSYSSLITVATPTTSYSHTGLAAGTTNYYKVIAKNSSGLAGNYSSVVSATTEGGLPAVPANLTATPADGLADGTFEIGLSWNLVSGATSYSVSRSTDDINYNEIETDATTNSFTDSDPGLTADTIYYYKVKANNASGSSAESASVETRTAPAAPINLAATAGSSSQITVTWDPVNGADSYDVLQASAEDGEYEYLANVPGAIYVDSALDASTAYYYKVQAKRQDGIRTVKSTLSSSVTATTLDP